MSHFLKLTQHLEKSLSNKAGKHLYLVRHGQSLGNYSGSIVGWTDSKLSIKGREQANMLYRSFHQHIDKFDSMHSSDLSRCIDTITLALGFPSKKIVENPSLRELNFGDEEGVHFDSLPEEKKKIVNSIDYQAPNGQNWMQVRQRALKYMNSLGNGHHLISTHGGLICSITHHLGIKHVVPNCSVIGVELCEDKKQIVNINFHWEFEEIID